MQEVHCPFCHQILLDDGSLAGQLVLCPNCRGRMQMPGLSNAVRCPFCDQLLVDDGSLAGQVVMCPSCQREMQMPLRRPDERLPADIPTVTASYRLKVIRPAGAIAGPGTFSVDVVGESHYQDAIAFLCGGKSREGVNHIVNATLVPEDDNPHDRQAVRVDVEGYTVGYLSRKHAREYRNQLRRTGYPKSPMSCRAKIVGGWDRGPDDTGYFGVTLDLPFQDS